MNSADLQARFKKLMSPSGRLMGTELISFDPGSATVRLEFQPPPSFLNVLGTVQGGFLTAMLDECAGIAGRLSMPPNRALPSITFSVSFLEAARCERLVGTGRVIKIDEPFVFLESSLYSSQDTLLAIMKVTALLRQT